MKTFSLLLFLITTMVQAQDRIPPQNVPLVPPKSFTFNPAMYFSGTQTVNPTIQDVPKEYREDPKTELLGFGMRADRMIEGRLVPGGIFMKVGVKSPSGAYVTREFYTDKTQGGNSIEDFTPAKSKIDWVEGKKKMKQEGYTHVVELVKNQKNPETLDALIEFYVDLKDPRLSKSYGMTLPVKSPQMGERDDLPPAACPAENPSRTQTNDIAATTKAIEDRFPAQRSRPLPDRTARGLTFAQVSSPFGCNYRPIPMYEGEIDDLTTKQNDQFKKGNIQFIGLPDVKFSGNPENYNDSFFENRSPNMAEFPSLGLDDSGALFERGLRGKSKQYGKDFDTINPNYVVVAPISREQIQSYNDKVGSKHAINPDTLFGGPMLLAPTNGVNHKSFIVSQKLIGQKDPQSNWRLYRDKEGYCLGKHLGGLDDGFRPPYPCFPIEIQTLEEGKQANLPNLIKDLNIVTLVPEATPTTFKQPWARKLKFSHVGYYANGPYGRSAHAIDQEGNLIWLKKGLDGVTETAWVQLNPRVPVSGMGYNNKTDQFFVVVKDGRNTKKMILKPSRTQKGVFDLEESPGLIDDTACGAWSSR